MSSKACRDCGEMVAPTARGCQNCARNLEAERMLAKYLWIGLFAVIILASMLFGLFIYGRK